MPSSLVLLTFHKMRVAWQTDRKRIHKDVLTILILKSCFFLSLVRPSKPPFQDWLHAVQIEKQQQSPSWRAYILKELVESLSSLPPTLQQSSGGFTVIHTKIIFFSFFFFLIYSHSREEEICLSHNFISDTRHLPNAMYDKRFFEMYSFSMSTADLSITLRLQSNSPVVGSTTRQWSRIYKHNSNLY